MVSDNLFAIHTMAKINNLSAKKNSIEPELKGSFIAYTILYVQEISRVGFVKLKFGNVRGDYIAGKCSNYVSCHASKCGSQVVCRLIN